jgi:hypothetical protein
MATNPTNPSLPPTTTPAPPITCPPGSHYAGLQGCVPDQPPGIVPADPRPNCSGGKLWSPGAGKCLCPGDSHDVGGECIGGPAPPTGPAAPGPGSNFGPCPEGMEHGGGHPGNPCKPIQASSSGGGGGGVASPAAFNPNAPQPGDDVEKQIWDYINGVLTGKNTAYNDQVVGNMKADAFRTATGRAAADKNSLSEDLISRGIFRSGIASSGMSAIDRGASTQYSKAVGDINQQKALSDYQNKIQALTMAQAWLDSKRNYLLQKESNAIQREIGLAQIKLGYAKIASEKELLQLQLAHMGGGGGGGDTTGEAETCRYRPDLCAPQPPPPGGY